MYYCQVYGLTIVYCRNSTLQVFSWLRQSLKTVQLLRQTFVLLNVFRLSFVTFSVNNMARYFIFVVLRRGLRHVKKMIASGLSCFCQTG